MLFVFLFLDVKSLTVKNCVVDCMERLISEMIHKLCSLTHSLWVYQSSSTTEQHEADFNKINSNGKGKERLTPKGA